MTEVVERIDDYGRPAWIALMVVGFILFWPIGLAILGFLLWSGRMGCGRGWASGADRRERFERKMERMRQKFGGAGRMQGIGSDSSYNASAGGYGSSRSDDSASASEFLQGSFNYLGEQLKVFFLWVTIVFLLQKLNAGGCCCSH